MCRATNRDRAPLRILSLLVDFPLISRWSARHPIRDRQESEEIVPECLSSCRVMGLTFLEQPHPRQKEPASTSLIKDGIMIHRKRTISIRLESVIFLLARPKPKQARVESLLSGLECHAATVTKFLMTLWQDFSEAVVTPCQQGAPALKVSPTKTII